MKVFLCGGGSGERTELAMKKFSKVIDINKPLLYVPLAMESYRYDSCLEWITNEIMPINIKKVEMVTSAKELAEKNYEDYCAIFIGGGNTYKLLNDLKETAAFERIKEYIEKDGIVFGGSAGAIIFGKDIDTCKYEDDNSIIKIKNTTGINILNDFSLLCHYGKREDQTITNTKHLIQFSRDKNVIYLPEKDTIFVNNDKVELIGNEKYCVFKKGKMELIDPQKTDIQDIIYYD